jgi:hypothetical protein
MLRIRRTRWKVLYTAGAVVLIFTANALLLPRVLPGLLALIAGDLLVMAVFFIGTRSFRGAGEPVAPPRALWRMTSKPRSGFVIASLFVVSATGNVFSSITRPVDELPAYVLSGIVDASLALLYLRSSVRLTRNPPETVAEPMALPKWKPIRR